jgi:hypothetical protein
MKILPLLSALVGGSGTFLAVNRTKLPVPAKIVLTLAGSGAGYLIGTKFTKFTTSRDSEDTVNSASSEVDKILKANKNLPPSEQKLASYTPTQMKSFANKLFKAMDGMGTDEDAVTDVFKAMNNDLDLLLLIEAFGVKDDENLTEFIEDDGMTSFVNKILETKGKITFRF